MKRRMNKKGFTIAEMLVALMVISLVLSAAIPTISKKNVGADGSGLGAGDWKPYDDSKSGQSDAPGAPGKPGAPGSPGVPGSSGGIYPIDAMDPSRGITVGINPLIEVFQFKKATTKNIEDNDINNIYIRNGGYSKGIFVKRIKTDNEPNWAASHLSFYNFYDFEPSKHLHYVGRFTADEYNLALGILSLQYLNPTNDLSWKGFNTAYGHHTLENNQTAYHNTAIGYAVLNNMKEFGKDDTTPNIDVSATNAHIYRKLGGNTGLGSFVLTNNTTGYGNTGIGHYALFNNTKGYHNIAIGSEALLKNTEGIENTAIGWEALKNTSDNYNIGIGNGALRNNNYSYNLALGISALRGKTSDPTSASAMNKLFGNLAVGHNAIRNVIYNTSYTLPTAEKFDTSGKLGNESGQYNTVVGHGAMWGRKYIEGSAPAEYNEFTNSGQKNVAIGYDALMGNHKGNYNTAVGFFSMGNNKHSGEYNTAVGYLSLRDNVSGENNIAIGARALDNNTKGSKNIAIGTGALDDSTEGDNNIAIGYEVAKHSTEGSNNIAIGKSALYNVKKMNDTIAIGREALYEYGTNGEPASTYNIAIGHYAMQKAEYCNAKTAANVALGKDALKANKCGHGNVAVGAYALVKNVGTTSESYDADNNSIWSGSHNTALGTYTLIKNTIGSRNVAIGTSAMSETVSGHRNVAVGVNALQRTTQNFSETAVNNDKGVSNVAVGTETMYWNYTGSYNVAIGESAMSGYSGYDYTPISGSYRNGVTGSNNVAIGHEALFYIRGGSNNIAIGAHAFSNGDDTNGITGSNNIVIGANAKVPDKAKSHQFVLGTDYLSGNMTGTKTLYLNGVSVSTTSDSRLKNIKGDFNAGLDEINKVEVKKFTFKNDKGKKLHVGVIAQQLQKIFPNSVSKDGKGYLAVNTDEMFYAMINSIKQLYAKFQELTAKVTGLDKRLNELEEQNRILREQNQQIKKQNRQIKNQNAEIIKRIEKLEAQI